MKKVWSGLWSCNELWALLNLLFGVWNLYVYENGGIMFHGILGVINLVCFFLMVFMISYEKGIR